MWQVLTILTLLGLMIARQFFDLQGATPFDPDSLAATGFIILAAFTMGELFKRLKMPALLGYIAAGIAFGPDLAHLVLGSTEHAIFGREVIGDLALINVLTVGVIGTLGGGELKISELKDQAGTILVIIAFSFIAIVALSSATVLGLVRVFPDLIPFLEGAPPIEQIAVALLFGVFGFAMSPAATLAIIQETRARGRFTSLTLGVVIVADLVLVASFLLAFNFAKLVVRPEGFSTQALIDQLPAIGAEFGWAIVVGAVTGAVFILYLRFVAREMLLFTVGLIFAAAAVSSMLHAETLLAFLTAGFIVQNFSKHGHDMIHALEKISVPVFVIYFMTQAAQLDLVAVAKFLPLAIILTIVRALALGGSVKGATGLRNSPEHIDSNLWMAFFSRGGVDIVLAGLVGAQIAGWGEDFRSVIMATVVIHIIAGPAILQWVFDRVGETEKARKAGSQEVAELDRIVGVEHEPVYEPLERPSFEDPALDRRLERISDELADCYQHCLVSQIEEHGQRLQHMLDRVHSVRTELLDDLTELLVGAEFDDREQLTEQVKQLHVRLRQLLRPQIDMVDSLDPMPITPETTDRLLNQIRELVDFSESYRVRMEDRLLEPRDDDGRLLRLVKGARRIRQSFGSGGQRTIPVGRLWRFYMELSVPGYLASAVAATAERNESLWYQMGIHLRRIDDLFEQVVRVLRQDLPAAAPGGEPTEEVEVVATGDLLSPSVDALPISMPADADGDLDSDEEHGHDDHAPADQAHGDADADEAGHPQETAAAQTATTDEDGSIERALRMARQCQSELEAEAEDLDAMLGAFVQTLRERFSFSIESAYGDFMDGVVRAGTVELPSFRYRPSSRYDEAHRAEARLHQRLLREANIVAGYQGWIVLDHQLVLFLHWYRTYQQRVVASLESRFDHGSLRALGRLTSRCEERPQSLEEPAHDQPVADWSRWYSEQIDPALENARVALEHALTDFGQGTITRRLMDALEARVARFSEEVELLVQNPIESVEEGSEVETVSIPLRSWYFSKLLREVALRLVEFNERGERILRRALVTLGDIEQLLQTELVVQQQELRDKDQLERANEIAERALQQAASQTTELIESVQADEHEMRLWVIEESTRVVRDSTAPFLEHRLREVMRELSKKRGRSLAKRSVQPIISRFQRAYRVFAPVVEQIGEDVRNRLAGESPAPDKSQVRERLLRTNPRRDSTTPAMYRRLYSPVPVDIPDFYVDRPELEDECLDAVDRWMHDQPTAMLIAGDRGMGKRTLVHHVLPARMFSKYQELDEDQLQTVRIDEQVETEPELCEAFMPLTGGANPRSFNNLVRLLHAGDKRQIVFVENGDKIYSRTRDGLALCERFLDVVEQTSTKVLWIILMGKPATTLLDTALQLSDYFTHSLEIEPLSSAQIEEMVMARHEVSGLDIAFEKPEVRYLERIEHPLDASDALRHPRKEFFERLGRLSGGNPLLALLYWLEAVRLDPTDNTRIIVDALPASELELIEELTLEKQLILATLVQHSALSAPRLSRILRMGLDEVQVELHHLERLGFVELITGTSSYHLRPLPGALVTQELRSRNLV